MGGGKNHKKAESVVCRCVRDLRGTQQTDEEAIAIYQSVEYANQQLMMRLKKKKKMMVIVGEEEEEELKQQHEEEQEEEEDEENNNSNNTTANKLNLNAEQALSQLHIWKCNHHMQIIKRLGATLATFSAPEMRSDSEWVTNACIQLMDDFAVVNQSIINGDPVIDFDVYSHIINEHFGGQECDGAKCQSVRERKRRRGRGKSQITTATSSSSSSPSLREMDRIHCAVLHAYQSAYKLYGNEREQMASVMRMADAEQDQEDNNNFAYDAQTECVRRLIGTRIIDRETEEQQHMQNKFVTQVNAEEEEMKQEVDEQKNKDVNGDDGDGNQSQLETYYAFGYKFYYWKKYKNNTRPDYGYNGGNDAYGVWYIEIKYHSLKEELMNAGVAVWQIEEQNESGMQWMETEYVKGMYAHGKVGDYDIRLWSSIFLSHILSVLFHCNFTSLCTLFSSTFRKLRSNETDNELRARNAEFREFAIGTKLQDSNITVFYHGISVVMQFSSLVARFCAPTSTTVAFTVAINFAKNG